MTDYSDVLRRLSLDNWVYERWFMPPSSVEMHPVVMEIEEAISNSGLEQHPFFDRAIASPAALRLWATQELVMTNAFSQIVLMATASVVNVHLRTMIGQVAFGEHGGAKGGIARRAHPWLLEQLRDSMGIPTNEVRPAPATIKLIDRLASATTDPLTAVAWIGVGNERLIIPEYTAVKRCFEACMPNVKYKKFLDANLHEDVAHTRMCYEFASALLHEGGDVKLYKQEALASIQGRLRYFDELLASLP